MAEDNYIARDIELESALDFEFLRKKGIEYAQELAGENWTDYNTHDPGVTILEQLAFAITDLGYRTQMDIKDLLASQLKPELAQRIGDGAYQTSFYTALDIFPTNPVTRFDFRKVLIDRIEAINNAWIIPLNKLQDNTSIKGIYLVLVEVNPKYVSNQEEEDQVKKEVIDQLHYHSNFGEAFEDVVILNKQELYLRCSIELEKEAIVEEVHAQVLFELEQYVTRPIRFYSLSEQMEKGIDISDVFEGPRLFNGFIEERDLKQKDSVFYNTELLNVIRSIEGIKSIKYLNVLEEKLDKNGKATYHDYYDKLANRSIPEAVIIEKDKVAVLGSKLYKDANADHFFTYFKEDVKINLYQREVDRRYKALQARVRLSYSKNFDQDNNLSIPLGEKKPIEEYYSIQNHFPGIYGLSREGLPPNLSEDRKTYVYQLKGYLMLFEQILSNYLMQLAQFNELLALDEKLEQSYFTQVPWDIPGVYKIINQVSETDSKEKTEEVFEGAVKHLMKGVDDFYDRRHRLLNHLLARVGDDGFEYSFEKFNYYHTNEAHQANILRNKLSILQSYPLLTRNKGRSFNPAKEFWGKRNYSMLESRVRMKVGLPSEMRMIAHGVEPYVHFSDRKVHVSLQTIIAEYEGITVREIRQPLMGMSMQESFRDEADPKWIADIEIDQFLFRRGIWEENLRIVESPSASEKGYFLLFKKKSDVDPISDDELDKFQHIIDYFVKSEAQSGFKLMLRHEGKSIYAVEFERNQMGKFLPNPTVIWKVLHRYETKEDAFKAAYSLKNNLIAWNQGSEGFYMVDHTSCCDHELIATNTWCCLAMMMVICRSN